MKHLQFKGHAPADATTAPQLKHQADTLTAEAFQLTDEQQAAVDGVLAFCNQSTGGNFASLNGPAGAGKSTTSRHLRQALIDQGFSVGLCAPTHKACGVLAKACGVDKADTATFASLLGLREVTKKDERDFIPMPGSKPRLSENDVWLADEASMMHPKLLGYIENATDFWNRIIFIGDQAQLSPIKFGRVSPALRCTPRFDLTKVMRHDGAVLDAATAIRQTTGSKWRVPFHHSQIGTTSAIFTYADKKEWQHAIFEMATDRHGKNDPDAFRVIAYRNDEVSRLNVQIRRHVYGRDAAPFLAGERVVTHEAVKCPTNRSELVYGSSRELVILEASPSEHHHPVCADGKPFKCWDLVTQTDEKEPPRLIRAIDPTHQGLLCVALDQLSAEAKKSKLFGQAAWDPFWELKESFAQLQPFWVITCHKAQGSQFRNVFVHGHDLDRANGGTAERRRLWYTAITRAQQAVHVIADKGMVC